MKLHFRSAAHDGSGDGSRSARWGLQLERSAPVLLARPAPQQSPDPLPRDGLRILRPARERLTPELAPKCADVTHTLNTNSQEEQYLAGEFLGFQREQHLDIGNGGWQLDHRSPQRVSLYVIKAITIYRKP